MPLIGCRHVSPGTQGYMQAIERPNLWRVAPGGTAWWGDSVYERSGSTPNRRADGLSGLSLALPIREVSGRQIVALGAGRMSRSSWISTFQLALDSA